MWAVVPREALAPPPPMGGGMPVLFGDSGVREPYYLALCRPDTWAGYPLSSPAGVPWLVTPSILHLLPRPRSTAGLWCPGLSWNIIEGLLLICGHAYYSHLTS